MTTPEKIEEYLLITIDEDYKPKVQNFIESVKAFIERYTGRTFDYDANSGASPKIYDGNGSSELFIDDAVEIEEVKVDNRIIEETDFRLYPSNRLPKTRIILPYRQFPYGAQNVSVTAKWGYGAVPKDLEFAATVMVAGIINSQRSKNEGGAVQSETIGRYSVTYATNSSQSHDFSEAKKILKLYRKLV